MAVWIGAVPTIRLRAYQEAVADLLVDRAKLNELSSYDG